jgi:hypothetical protein
MFYSTQILAKKGPLGLVWIAAHLDGRLKRQQITSASIDDSVETLLHPEAPLALRLSGQLLLGVVRIYQRKVRWLGPHRTSQSPAVRHAAPPHPAQGVAAAASLCRPPHSHPHSPRPSPAPLTGQLLVQRLRGGGGEVQDCAPGARCAPSDC